MAKKKKKKKDMSMEEISEMASPVCDYFNEILEDGEWIVPHALTAFSFSMFYMAEACSDILGTPEEEMIDNLIHALEIHKASLRGEDTPQSGMTESILGCIYRNIDSHDLNLGDALNGLCYATFDVITSAANEAGIPRKTIIDSFKRGLDIYERMEAKREKRVIEMKPN